MAESSGIPPAELMLLQIRNQLQPDEDAGCTSFSAVTEPSPASPAVGDSSLVGQNWDNDPALDQMTIVLTRRPDITVLNGNDEFLFPGLLYGAHGGIGMNYNLFPRLFLGIHRAAAERDLERGMDLQNRFLAYADVFWRYGGIKANFEVLMRDRGLATHCWRRPRPVMDEETTRKFLAEVRPTLAAMEEAQHLAPHGDTRNG